MLNNFVTCICIIFYCYFFTLCSTTRIFTIETSCIDCQPGKKAKNDQVARTEETNACTNCLVGQYRPSQIEVNGVMTDTELTECK